MKKKMLSLALAAAMLVGAAVPAMAVRSSAGADGHVMEQYPTQPFVGSPSGGQKAQSDNEEIEIVTDNVVTGGYIRQRGTAEPRPLEQIDYRQLSW